MNWDEGIVNGTETLHFPRKVGRAIWKRQVLCIQISYGSTSIATTSSSWNVVQFAPSYVSVSESVKATRVTQSKMTRSNSTRSSNDRSGGGMEEDIKTAKSEFRLGMHVFCTESLYTRKWGRGNVTWVCLGLQQQRPLLSLGTVTVSASLCPWLSVRD